MHASNTLFNSWASIGAPIATICERGGRSPHLNVRYGSEADVQINLPSSRGFVPYTSSLVVPFSVAA